jgi:hypothetical protein
VPAMPGPPGPARAVCAPAPALLTAPCPCLRSRPLLARYPLPWKREQPAGRAWACPVSAAGPRRPPGASVPSAIPARAVAIRP